jgi:hypothetical protein
MHRESLSRRRYLLATPHRTPLRGKLLAFGHAGPAKRPLLAVLGQCRRRLPLPFAGTPNHRTLGNLFDTLRSVRFVVCEKSRRLRPGPSVFRRLSYEIQAVFSVLRIPNVLRGFTVYHPSGHDCRLVTPGARENR